MKLITYYKVTFTLESSLSIGSGIGEYTDKDIVVDRNGTPYIPASSIAGVMRSSLDDEKKNLIFGSIDDGANEGCVRIYDAVLCDNSSYIATRDCVALSEKVAKDGAKFDFQTVEPGVSFEGYIEVRNFNTKISKRLSEKNTDAAEEIENALNKFNTGELRLGGKTTRGYGRVSVSVSRCTFNLSKVSDSTDAAVYSRDEWLKFDMYSADSSKWTAVTLEKADEMPYITLNLKNTAGVTIREYTTDYSPNTALPDYRQISLHNAACDGVIPGTSWAGAFRQRYEEFTNKSAAEGLFGIVKTEYEEKDGIKEKKEIAAKSKIVFSESVLKGGTKKQLTRNSIDRFSAATKTGALYTEQTYYGGTTVLTLSFPKGTANVNMKILASVILDLHYGYMAIGGLTAVGRGIFNIESFKTNIDATADVLIKHGIKKYIPKEEVQ